MSVCNTYTHHAHARPPIQPNDNQERRRSITAAIAARWQPARRLPAAPQQVQGTVPRHAAECVAAAVVVVAAGAGAEEATLHRNERVRVCESERARVREEEREKGKEGEKGERKRERERERERKKERI